MSKVTRRFFIKEIEVKVVNRETEKVETVNLENVTGEDGKKLERWIEKKIDGVMLKYSIVKEYSEIRWMTDEYFFYHSDFLADER